MAELPRIIVGLGNPGKNYEGTRHNAGFMVLDELARHWNLSFQLDKTRKAMLAGVPGVLLVKPITFMNDSGLCVGPLMRYFKLQPSQVLVVYDEIAFPFGTLQLRPGGSAGGHNGIKSLIAHLGDQNFPRLRFGIGPPRGHQEMIAHVLGKFRPEEQELLPVEIAKAVDEVLCVVAHGIDYAANLYNS